MFRRIEWRVWSYKHKEMCNIDETITLEFEKKGHWFARTQGGEIFCCGFQGREDSGELMQWTGLKDVNGNWIYEGDILKSYKFKKTGEPNGSRPIKIVTYKELGTSGIGFNVGVRGLTYKVIGNIYSNPDLLK